MHSNSSGVEQSSEQTGYFEVPGADLYAVLHAVPNPIARMVLVGPFAAARHASYIPWVRWARYLAERQIECLRYDYRGVGESTGVFEEMTFENWVEDVEVLAAWLRSQSPTVPLFLHGLELGCILAAHAYLKGRSDALLLWAPTTNANEILHAQLVRTIAQEQLFKYGDARKPLSDYVREMEMGNTIEVDGYQWSAELWASSFSFKFPSALLSERPMTQNASRRVKIVELDNRAAPLVKGSSVGYDMLNKDFSWLYADSFEWADECLGLIAAGGNETSY